MAQQRTVADAMNVLWTKGITPVDDQRTVADAMNDLWTKGIKPVDDTKAPKNSPALTGTPTAPTPEISDNSDRLATTKYCLQLLQNLIGEAPEVLNTLGEIAAALKNNPDVITNILTQLSAKMDTTTANNTFATKTALNAKMDTTTANNTFATKSELGAGMQDLTVTKSSGVTTITKPLAENYFTTSETISNNSYPSILAETNSTSMSHHKAQIILSDKGTIKLIGTRIELITPKSAFICMNEGNTGMLKIEGSSTTSMNNIFDKILNAEQRE